MKPFDWGRASAELDADGASVLPALLTPAECEVLATTLGSNQPPADSGRWLEWMGRNLPPDKLESSVSPLMSRWTTEDYRAAGSWLGPFF